MKWLCNIVLLSIATLGHSQSELKTYSFEEVEDAMQKESRPVFVFIYADWCKVCHQMKATTFSDSSVVARLNSTYYFISFDGESKDPVQYQGVKYTYEPSGIDVGTHQLARTIGTINGKVNYPTLCILKNKTDLIFQHGGALDAPELIKVLEAAAKD